MLHITTPRHPTSEQRPPTQKRNALTSRSLMELNTRKRRSRGESPSLLQHVKVLERNEIVREYLESLDSPRSLAVWLMFSNNEHKQLVEYSVDSRSYLEVCLPGLPSLHDFRRDYAASKFLSKCVGLNTGIDLKGVAIASAFKAEDQCKSTNQRLILESKCLAVMPEVVQRNFFRITSKIASILGELPASFEDAGWSPGRTSSAWGAETASVFKYSSQLDVTLSARSKAVQLVRDSPIWGAGCLDAVGPVSVLQSAFITVKGNTMITVPKNAKTDRVICYEPHMNIRLQLAVGTYMKQRLSKHGVNLYDQSINQRRAKFASLYGSLATIDLSMASDTLCRELVYQLLPIDWALHLDDLRSKYTLWPDGQTRRNEKFSSMGNGFTFELESLIFYAIASSVSNNVSVYGDDLIVPTASFEDTKSILEWAGFLLNERKSFHEGYFRESCGYDGFRGLNCTPVYLRSLPKRVEDVIHLHNRVREWCSQDSCPDSKYIPILEKWRNIHTCYHGPQGYGDGHYHVDHDVALYRASYGLDGWWFKTYSRSYAVNTTYGDRLSGSYSGRLGWSALCASTGPKRVRDASHASVDRRQFTFKSVRVLASFTWPSVNWYHY